MAKGVDMELFRPREMEAAKKETFFTLNKKIILSVGG